MMQDEEAIDLFKSVLRFRTVSAEGPRTGSYASCVAFLEEQVARWCPGIKIDVVSPVPNKPVLVAKFQGTDPELEGVVLNAHYDVVPAIEEKWTKDPWGAIETEDGRIYGRGTQDMKIVLVQYIAALSRLQSQNKTLKRSVTLLFVPDEEIGGKDGMGAFLEKGFFDSLVGNAGVVLDEGLANPNPGEYTVFYGERFPLWVFVEAKGPTGHGSRFIQNTATSKLVNVANKALEYRKTQEQLLGHSPGGGCKHCEAKKLGDVLTINLTLLRAGVSADGGQTFSLNVIPTDAIAGFDIRVPVTTPVEDVEAMLNDWTKEEGVSWRYDPNTGTYEDIRHVVTSVDPKESKWWDILSKTYAAMDMKIVTEIFPAGTDSKKLRQKGLPAFGFSPMAGSPILLHEHDEYIDRSVFLKGINIYEKVIEALANAP